MLKSRPDQADMRSQATFTDQHGRPWDCTIDNRRESKFAPVTPPIPLFRPPFDALLPSAAYLKPVIGQVGKLRIDYDAWLADVQRERRAYDEQKRELAVGMYKGSLIAQAIADPPPELLAMLGRAPVPPDFVRAMRAGNKWALGLRRADGTPYPMPPWAEPLLSHLVPAQTATTAEEDAAHYPDVEDDVVDAEEALPAEILADRLQYQDLEDAVDPEATGGRRTGRRRTPAGTEA